MLVRSSVATYIYPSVIFLSLLSKMLMSVKRILISVDWEHVVIMMMEHSMSVNVKMEL